MASFKKTKAAISKQVDREIREELRARRKALADRVSELKKRRRAGVRNVREWCKRSRLRVNDRAKEIRAEHRRQANEEIGALRRASKDACARRVERAKKRGLSEQQIAAQERRRTVSDERLFSRASSKVRDRQRIRSTKRERAGEDNDQVRNNLEAELQPVWDRLADDFKPRRDISRTEQFLQWVEENPDEVMGMRIESAELAGAAEIERLQAEAEAEHARVSKLLTRKAKLKPTDLELLGVDVEAMRELGLVPSDPDDVLAFMHGETDYLRQDEAIPF